MVANDTACRQDSAMHKPRLALALSAALLLAGAASAQPEVRTAPQAAPLPPAIPPAQDVPYPGTIALDIDATDLERGVYRVKQTVPVPQGARELVLLLPEWIPGKHGPRGPINLLADLRVEVDGRAAEWTRDPVEVYAFRVPLPAGARAVTASFVHTSPLQTSEGRITMTREMLNLQWDAMTLYPAGHYVRQIRVTPTVTFPDGWTAFTALDGQRARGNRVSWATTDYETLVDSPVFAGKHAREWDLGNGVALDVVADEARLLELKPEHLARFRKLVDEALATFGPGHYDHYEFLLALTDRLGGIGLEHQRSSENDYKPEAFLKWDELAWDRNVIPHELVHSWNGKYRRPEGMWTPDYREPMRDNLLWLYEGQTQFWGWILSARSGLQPKDVVLGAIANNAGYYAMQPGRAWRSVEDTTFDPITNARRPLPYSSLSRSEDYYSEGMMVWLEADQIIRAGTGGARGLDDFARAFFGGVEGDMGQLTYRFEDVIAALNAVHPHDWASFLDTRFRESAQPAPLAGLEKGGYRLVWQDEPNPYEKGRADDAGYLNLQYSLGINVDKDGTVSLAHWGTPAFDAGVVRGAQIVAVDGEAYSADRLKRAIAAAKGSERPIVLLVKRGERYLETPIRYGGGLRYPWVEPAAEGEQPLDRLLAARTG
jgi:predicted metalloprotease with PDZ domain